MCFHIDDCKLSHKSSKVLDAIIKWLRKEYESIFEDRSGEMAISRGKVHTYLWYLVQVNLDKTDPLAAKELGRYWVHWMIRHHVHDIGLHTAW
jgi:hypothetical protein